MRLLCMTILLVGMISISYSAEDQDTLVDSKVQDEDELEATPQQKLNFIEPKLPANAFFTEFFTGSSDMENKWKISKAKKDGVEDAISKYDGEWSVEVPKSSALENDFSLVLKSKARHSAIASNLARQIDFDTKQIVIQYEVKFQEGQECGGAYVKLLSENIDLTSFNDKSSYTVMFGPDRCGMDNKLHLILRHKNKKSGEYEEKHAPKPKGDIEKYFTDKKTHLYTLVLNDDNTFEIFVDQTIVNSGHLLKDLEPAINPPKEIDDPNDSKPADWDEREKIVDETAVKPDDWDETEPEMIEDSSAKKPDGWLDDEPLLISDPKAVKPADWDDDMDGEWEAPKIDNEKCKNAPGCGEWKAPKIKNPKYKGKWAAPMIENPNYKGIWKPRVIPNPNYVEDSSPYHGFSPISAVGIEIWSMTDEIAFDNFIITDNKKDADNFAAETWAIKYEAEKRADPSSQSVVDAVRNATSERPWIWAVIAAVIIIPTALILYCCCRSSGEVSSDKYDHKKTDETLPDDEILEESTTSNNIPDGDHGSIHSTPKGSKSPLLNGKSDSDSSDGETSGKSSPKKVISSEEEESRSEEQEISRKRKVRKD